MAVTLDRLKSQLLTSGLQQDNFALFQVVNQLIDYLRGEVAATQAAISGGSGGGGGGGGVGLVNATYLTKNKEVGLPNSLQTLAGAGIQFNDAHGRRIISTALPFGMDGEQGEEGVPGPPGRIGIDGATGAPGADGASMLAIDGENGIDGDPGIPGPQGFTGPAGAIGAQGTSGSTSGPPYIEPEEPELPYMIPGPAGADGSGGGGSDWDIELQKTADDTENAGVYTDDSELITPLENSSKYYGEFCIIYSGNNATGDHAFRLRMGGNVTLALQFMGYITYPNTNLAIGTGGMTGANSGSDAVLPSPFAIGTDALNTKLQYFGQFVIVTPAAWAGDGNLAVNFKVNSFGAGRTTTIYTGSILRLKKLA